MEKYKLHHLILIIASVIFTGIGLLWIFHYIIPNPYPNEEYYLLLMMYLVMLGSTAIIFKTKKLKPIHAIIGFKSIKFKPVSFAFMIAFVIWGIDYFYQTIFLDIDIKIEATNWYENQANLLVVFFSTVIFTPIIEEMLFRGIILQSLNQYLSKIWSAITLSVVFALIHIDFLQAPINLSQVPTLIFASLIYVWLTYKYKSIIPAIIAHIINNCLTFFYYMSIIGI